MIRARFHANHDDWRPVKFPPPGPAYERSRENVELLAEVELWKSRVNGR